MRPFYLLPQEEWLGPLSSPLDDESLQREQILQWMLRELIETYHYPVDWLQARMQKDVLLKSGNIQKKFDLVLSNRMGEPFLACIIRLRADLNEVGGANDQLRTIIAGVPSLLWGIVTNGEEIFIWNKKEQNILQREKTIVSFSPPLLDIVPIIAGTSSEQLLRHLHQFVQSLLSMKYERRSVLSEVVQILLLKMYDESIQEQGYHSILQKEQYSSLEEYCSSLESLWRQWLTLHNTGRSSGGSLFSPTLFAIDKTEVAKLFGLLRDVPCFSLLSQEATFFIQSVLTPLLYPDREDDAGLSSILLNGVVAMARLQSDEVVLDATCFSGGLLQSIATEFSKTASKSLFHDLSLLYSLYGITGDKFAGQVAFLHLFLKGFTKPNILLQGTNTTLDRSWDAWFHLKRYSEDGFNQKNHQSINLAELQGIGEVFDALEGAHPQAKLVFSIPSIFLNEAASFRVQKWLLSTLSLFAVVSLPAKQGFVPTSVLFCKVPKENSVPNEDHEILFAEIEEDDDIQEVASNFVRGGEWR
jgi:hypothetical protein